MFALCMTCVCVAIACFSSYLALVFVDGLGGNLGKLQRFCRGMAWYGSVRASGAGVVSCSTVAIKAWNGAIEHRA